MALSIGFRIFSLLPSCYSSYGALNFYPGGTFTHCSCQPSLDAPSSVAVLLAPPQPGGVNRTFLLCANRTLSFCGDTFALLGCGVSSRSGRMSVTEMGRHQTAETEGSNYSRLLAQLDAHPNSAERAYIHLYQKLLRIFEWRGCHHPEEAVDATLDRVERKLSEGATVTNIHAFIMGVARLVCLEFLRAQQRFVPLTGHELSLSSSAGDRSDEALDCLERCVEKLPPVNREFIRSYYESEDRAALASSLGVNLNILRLRASRLRAKLEECILTCLRRSEA